MTAIHVVSSIGGGQSQTVLEHQLEAAGTRRDEAKIGTLINGVFHNFKNQHDDGIELNPGANTFAVGLSVELRTH